MIEHDVRLQRQRVRTACDSLMLSTALAVGLTLFFQVIANSDNPRGTWLREGGIVENAQAFLFFVAGIGFVVAVKSSRTLREGPPWRYLPIILWAALMFFVCGEEISWGQRIFGFEVPVTSPFAGNIQNETNFHNLPAFNRSKAIYVNYFILAFGIVLPIMALYRPIRWLVGIFAFPVAPLVLMPIFAAAYLLHSYQIYSFEEFGYMPREYSELLIALGFASVAWYGAGNKDSLFRLD